MWTSKTPDHPAAGPSAKTGLNWAMEKDQRLVNNHATIDIRDEAIGDQEEVYQGAGTAANTIGNVPIWSNYLRIKFHWPIRLLPTASGQLSNLHQE